MIKLLATDLDGTLLEENSMQEEIKKLYISYKSLKSY